MELPQNYGLETAAFNFLMNRAFDRFPMKLSIEQEQRFNLVLEQTQTSIVTIVWNLRFFNEIVPEKVIFLRAYKNGPLYSRVAHMERTFVMLKPGVLQRRIAADVLGRFERKGLRIIALKLTRLDRALAETHYAEHRGKDFYEKLVDYVASAPVVAMILEGEDAVAATRRLAGPTKAGDAPPGTIRGDFAAQTRLNIVHASDSQSNAEREMALFFADGEIFPWEDGNAQWF
jgi:nucleoside-diphosphate kinase